MLTLCDQLRAVSDCNACCVHCAAPAVAACCVLVFFTGPACEGATPVEADRQTKAEMAVSSIFSLFVVCVGVLLIVEAAADWMVLLCHSFVVC